MPVSEAELRFLYPEIAWDEPTKVINAETNEERWACRYCIAQYGLKGSDQEGLESTREAVLEHIKQFHDPF